MGAPSFRCTFQHLSPKRGERRFCWGIPSCPGEPQPSSFGLWAWLQGPAWCLPASAIALRQRPERHYPAARRSRSQEQPPEPPVQERPAQQQLLVRERLAQALAVQRLEQEPLEQHLEQQQLAQEPLEQHLEQQQLAQEQLAQEQPV